MQFELAILKRAMDDIVRALISYQQPAAAEFAADAAKLIDYTIFPAEEFFSICGGLKSFVKAVGGPVKMLTPMLEALEEEDYERVVAEAVTERKQFSNLLSYLADNHRKIPVIRLTADDGETIVIPVRWITGFTREAGELMTKVTYGSCVGRKIIRVKETIVGILFRESE